RAHSMTHLPHPFACGFKQVWYHLGRSLGIPWEHDLQRLELHNQRGELMPQAIMYLLCQTGPLCKSRISHGCDAGHLKLVVGLLQCSVRLVEGLQMELTEAMGLLVEVDRSYAEGESQCRG